MEKMKEKFERLDGHPISLIIGKVVKKFDSYEKEFEGAWEKLQGLMEEIKEGKKEALEEFKMKLEEGERKCKSVFEDMRTFARKVLFILSEMRGNLLINFLKFIF